MVWYGMVSEVDLRILSDLVASLISNNRRHSRRPSVLHSKTILRFYERKKGMIRFLIIKI